MKYILMIAALCTGLFLASCSGTNQQGAGTDSPEKANDTTYNADTVIRSTDTGSTGVDNSGSGGVDAADSTH